MIYSFNFSSESIKIDDLIMNEKKIKKEENKEMNTLSHIKF